MHLSPYLFFTTAYEPALAFYTACGPGRVTRLLRHGDQGMPMRTEAMHGRIMHARFEGPGVRFFTADNDDAEPMRGSAMMLMLHDQDLTRRLFARLAGHGQVTTPLAVQPWGDFYGKLTDAFGVQWMSNCTPGSTAPP